MTFQHLNRLADLRAKTILERPLLLWLVLALAAILPVIFGACGSRTNRELGPLSEEETSLQNSVTTSASLPESSTGLVDGPAKDWPGGIVPADIIDVTAILGSPLNSSSNSAYSSGATSLASGVFKQFSGKRLGLIVNQASLLEDGRHLVDAAVADDSVTVTAIFGPEHGFRGLGAAGQTQEDEIDPKTGIPVYSLYGDQRSPSSEMLADVDVLIYDLPDVGTRYYTYIATMGLAMQAAAAHNITFVVADRASIRAWSTSGYTRASDQVSFVSPYPIPSLYAMTAGELARAIKGEAWLAELEDLDLKILPASGWRRNTDWRSLGLQWKAPSPGLPSWQQAMIYPATVLFEATDVSFGQGTDKAFAQIGAPWLDSRALVLELQELGLPGVSFKETVFTPQALPTAPNPRFMDESIPGVELTVTDYKRFEPAEVGVYLLAAVSDQGSKPIIDRAEMFDLLAGSDRLRLALVAGVAPAEIIAEWQTDLDSFETIRQRYLIYP